MFYGLYVITGGLW